MKNKRGLGCALTGLLLVVLLCAGVAGFAAWRLNTKAPQIAVQIVDPQQTAITHLNESLPLVVSAEANAPVVRLEVYADGILIAAANGNGLNTALLAQTWAPTTPGRHVLVARAFLDENTFADSQVAFVDALDLSSLPIQVQVDDLPRGQGITDVLVNDLAAASGTTPEEIARLNPSLASGGSIPAGTVVSLPRPLPLPVEPAPVPPPAPGAPGSPVPSASDPRFDGETHSCSQISMRWSDAPDETSYRLYRLSPGEDVMSLQASLPANTTTYTDSSVTRIGTYRYFLAPLRPFGEGVTSMLAVEIAPDCAPAGLTETLPDVRLSLLNLTAQESYNGIYCYISVNGSRYERLPAGEGLLLPTAGNLSYDLPLQLPSRGQYTLAPAADGMIRLEGECWGRRGVESVRLGRFSGNHASTEWDGRDLTSEVLAFDPRSVASIYAMPPSAGGAAFIRYRIAPAAMNFDIASLYGGVLQVPPVLLEPLRRDSPSIPAPVNVRLVNRSLGACEDLPTSDPTIGTILCEEQIIRHIAWDWSPSDVVPQSAITGFMVSTSIEDVLSTTPAGVGYSTPVHSGTARSTPVPNYSQRWRCGAVVRFTVRAITHLGMSEPSAPYEVRLPACPSANNLLIRVESLTISPSSASGQVLDLGDICILCDDRRFEMFGNLVLADGQSFIGTTNHPSHGAGTVLFGLCPQGTRCRNEGTYTTNSGWWIEMDHPINNRPLTFSVAITDYDTENSHDLFCVALSVLAPRSAQEWSRTNETVILQSDFGEAACRFEITVTGQ